MYLRQCFKRLNIFRRYPKQKALNRLTATFPARFQTIRAIDHFGGCPNIKVVTKTGQSGKNYDVVNYLIVHGKLKFR